MGAEDVSVHEVGAVAESLCEAQRAAEEQHAAGASGNGFRLQASGFRDFCCFEL